MRRSSSDKIGKPPLIVLLGNNASFTTKFPSKVLAVNGQTILTMDRNESGEIAISMDIYDRDNKIVTEIQNNKFSIVNDVFLHPRKDLSHLTVIIKDHKETVLDIRYLNHSTIKIIGTFRYPGLPTLKITEQSTEFNGKLRAVNHNCSGDNRGTQFNFTDDGISIG